MPKKSDKDRVKEWQKRVDGSTKVHEQWEKKYRTKLLYDYYLGHQWKEQGEASDENYTINLVFSTIETQLPAQLFYHPRFIVKARPSKSDDVQSTAENRAQLQEDTVNTFVTDPQLKFKPTVEAPLLESYFRFGVVEVGYTADFIDNPNANKPILKDGSTDELRDSEGQPVGQPVATIKGEWLYLKHIPADSFRVSITSKPILEQCDWYGYFEWFYPADLKRNKKYKNTSDLTTTGRIKNEYDGGADMGTLEERKQREGMVKLWKIWDVRGKMRRDFIDGGSKFLLEEPMDVQDDGTPVCPHSVLMKNPRLNTFLPLPPVFNWVSPQDELNEARNMQKIYRRKLIPKYGVKDTVDQSEIDKFLEPAIQLIRLSNADALWPIGMPPADAALMRAIPMTKEDFLQITGTGGDRRGVAESETATQANILDAHAQIRESRSRVQVADWLAKVGWLMLWFLRTRMILPFWVRRNVDLMGPNSLQETLNVQQTWEQITNEKLGEINSEVTVDVDSISPATQQGERQDWLAALQIIGTYPVLLADDTLLRKTMGYFGVRSDKELASLKRLGAMIAMAQAAAAQAKAGGTAQGAPSPQAPPGNPAIAQQLKTQMGS